MKTLTPAELKEIAADVFARNPKMQNLALTEDGQAFCIDDTDANVKHHVRQNRYKAVLKTYPFARAEVIIPAPLPKKGKGSKAADAGIVNPPKNDEK